MDNEQINILLDLHHNWINGFSKNALQLRIRNEDLSAANFSRANLKYAVFKNTDLSLANFFCANLKYCTFIDCNFTNANLSRASMFGSMIVDSDFRNSNLIDTDWRWADIDQSINLKPELKKLSKLHRVKLGMLQKWSLRKCEF